MVKTLPVKDPVIKLIPTIKLIGKFIVSLNIRFTFFLFKLFCIPISKIKNKEELNIIVKTNFLNGENIY